MKTNNSTKLQEGKGIVFLLTVFLWLTGTMSVQATDYDLWVGGKRVTSSNANNITNSTINGLVSYNASTKTLTLNNVDIDCSGNNSTKQGIYNKGIEGLTIRCFESVSIFSEDNAGLQCDVKTALLVESGTTWIESDNSRAVYINGSNSMLVSRTSSSKLYVTGNYCPAIEGTSSTSGIIHIVGRNIEIEGTTGDLLNLEKVYFRGKYSYQGYTGTPGCNVRLVYTGASSYPNVKNVGSMPCNTKSVFEEYLKDDRYAIVTTPKPADFVSSKKSICDSSGNPIYNTDIYFTEDFAVVVGSRYFPDANFRNYLYSNYGSYLTESQVNNITKLELANKSIANLTGIKHFTELKELYLYNNLLTQLDLSKNTKLTRLECPNNRLTSLDVSLNTQLIGVTCDDNQLTLLIVPYNNLQWLSCSNNQLTSCLTNNTHTKLKELYCAYNTGMNDLGIGRLFSYLPELEKFDCSGTSFSVLTVSSCTKLKELTCENMPLLTNLGCINTALTTLSVSGCSALEQLHCYDNKLTYLDVYGCTSLKYINCKNNQLSSIAYLSSCKAVLENLYITSNKFTSLDRSDFSKLNNLYCSNNQLTSLTGLEYKKNMVRLDCSSNQLTSLNLSGCNLVNLICNNNRLSTMNLFGTPFLTTIDCSYNSTLTSLDLLTYNSPRLSEVNCSYCGLTSIDWKNLKLTTLDCSYNSNLTMLNNSRDDGVTARPLSSLNVKGCYALNSINVAGNELTSLDLTGLGNLAVLECYNNQLTSLTLRGCTSLEDLYCGGNPLTSLNLNDNSNIKTLDCPCTQIAVLNVKGFTRLTTLSCWSSNIVSLDLRGCNALEQLDCDRNQIESLILPKENTVLNDVICDYNNLEGVMMDVFVESLPDRNNKEPGFLLLLGVDSDEHNVCTSQNIRDANSKNWNTFIRTDDGSFIPYSGPGGATTIRTADADVDDNAPRYNMSGQRVGRDYKGVIIVNGKKKVVK